MSVPSSAYSRANQLPPLTGSPLSEWWGNLRLGYKIGFIPVLFIVALFILESIAYTNTTRLRSDARLVDVASRQRVLNYLLQAQILGIAQGIPADWHQTIDRFNYTAEHLISGGDTEINMDTKAHEVIPAASSAEVVAMLNQQKVIMADMAAAAQAYLDAPKGSAERAERYAEFKRQGDTLKTLTNDTAKQLTTDSQEALDRTLKNQIIAAAIAAFVGLVLSSWIANRITQPVDRVVNRAQEIGAGDLRGAPLPVQGMDEVGRLSLAFNTMQEGLRTVAGQAQAAAESLAAAAAEILASSQEQAAGSGEQAAAVQETTTTMEEISRSGSQIADKARQVASSAEATSAASEAGLHAVREATRSMDTIQQQAQSVAENVVALSEKTRAIGDIIATVNEISEQSHLLALNAAIEAAGAGEQGRRFGVVADEMKHLADQSREATVQVRSILSDIQKQIHTAVLVTEESVKRTEDGKRQSDTAETTIRRMASSIVDSVNAFQQIVAAANQQQIGFEQVTQAAQQIRAAVDQATVGTRQMESAAVNVNTLSQQLRTAIEAYRL